MDSSSSSQLDFGFAFKSDQFSDRTLRIVILPDDHNSPPTCRKRLRHHQLHNSQELFVPMKKQTCDLDELLLEGSTHISEEDQDLEAVAGIHDASLLKDTLSNQSGDEASQKNESSSEMHHFQEKVFPVSSVLLAAHSPFFHKLFSNGMRETGQQHATIHIQASEEAAFMDLLNYMYTRSLSRTTTPSALLDVLMTADKFAVESCVKLCGQLLLNLPMTLESACLYLGQASTGLRVGSVRPLLGRAGEFLAEHFKYMKKDALWEKLLDLPLVSVGVVLSSDCLEVDSEDDIYDFMLQWVETHYSDDLVQRRKILNRLVQRFLRFPFLTTKKLDSVLTCSDIDPAIVSKLAIGALRYYKAHPPHEAPKKFTTKRNYKNLSLKAVAIGDSSSHPQCIVYLDFRRDACEAMFPDGEMGTETFFVGEKEFSMIAYCCVPQDEVFPCFGLFISASTPVSETGFTISFEIAPWVEQEKYFVRQCKRNITLTSEMPSAGWIDVFEMPWTTFIRRGSPYFVNDILRLRCTLRIENE